MIGLLLGPAVKEKHDPSQKITWKRVTLTISLTPTSGSLECQSSSSSLNPSRGLGWGTRRRLTFQARPLVTFTDQTFNKRYACHNILAKRRISRKSTSKKQSSNLVRHLFVQMLRSYFGQVAQELFQLQLLNENAVAMTRCMLDVTSHAPTRSLSILSKWGKVREQLAMECAWDSSPFLAPPPASSNK